MGDRKINFKFFGESYILTIIGVILAYFWSEHIAPGSGLIAIFSVLVLGILEVSLSFDNAVINAMKLEHMTDKWRHRFLTWGILIAVFGMRLLFPILVVSIFANLSMLEVFRVAIYDSNKYTQYLQLTHAPIIIFGGTFLLMLFLHYFLNNEKETHWISFIEEKLCKCGTIQGIEVIITLLALCIVQNYIEESNRLPAVIAGISGIILYLFIDGISNFLEQKSRTSKYFVEGARNAGLVSFLYLELIDASFSLDGVLGAFAISKDIIIITIGLGIGAIFVRSLTLMLVEKKVLKQFVYLEHGAHWAIGTLSIIMLCSSFYEIPEVITGITGLVFIVSAFVSSVIYNKNNN